MKSCNRRTVACESVMHEMLTFPWAQLLFIFLALNAISAADNLVVCAICSTVLALEENRIALLSGTLRTIQKAACEGDTMTLRCPLGTAVAIQLAQYGRVSPGVAICPRSVGALGDSHHLNDTCALPQSLQYNLLQTVVEACMKKRHCKFSASIKDVSEPDPCPHISKFVEVAYKCRPSEFRSKVICQNDTINLKCKRNGRIAIYSASFGRTKYDSLQCPQPGGVEEENCQASFSTETVMQMCHGKRRCALTASSETFGNPCSSNSKLYLQVVYTCVSRRILKDQYQSELEEDESDSNLEDEDESSFENDIIQEAPQVTPSTVTSFSGGRQLPASSADSFPKQTRTTNRPEAKSSGFFGLRSEAGTRPIATEIDMQGDIPINTVIEQGTVTGSEARDSQSRDEKGRVVGFVTDWISAVSFMKENQEKFILYLTLSIAAGILVLLSLLIGRLWWQRRKARKEAKLNANDPIPAFADSVSDIDNDIDLTLIPPPLTDVTTIGPTPTSEGVRYSIRGTLPRPVNDMTNPRSFNHNGNSHYYYG